ncbi:hypothetical protein WG66_004708 [Moniliophthora roreri]|nr:hypothetical protein WG66_004708 [Moniliophthora roreri]
MRFASSTSSLIDQESANRGNHKRHAKLLASEACALHQLATRSAGISRLMLKIASPANLMDNFIFV